MSHQIFIMYQQPSLVKFLLPRDYFWVGWAVPFFQMRVGRNGEKRHRYPRKARVPWAFLVSETFWWLQLTLESKTWPRKMSVSHPILHFFLLRRSSLSPSLWNRLRKSLMWSLCNHPCTQSSRMVGLQVVDACCVRNTVLHSSNHTASWGILRGQGSW